MAVHQRHLAATTERLEQVDEPLALLGEDWQHDSSTVGDAISQLTGPDRIRVEELLAAMPSSVTLTRTP